MEINILYQMINYYCTNKGKRFTSIWLHYTEHFGSHFSFDWWYDFSCR